MGIGLAQCDGCEGCGQVADTTTREPWIYYTRDLVDADGRSIFPEVRPVMCGKCGGSGRIPIHKLNAWRKKRGIR